MGKFFFVGILLFSFNLKAEVNLYVDVRDLALMSDRVDAKLLVQQMSVRPGDFFPPNISFRMSGALKASATRVNSVYGVEFYKSAQVMADGSSDLFVLSLYNSQTQGFVFRKLIVNLSADHSTLSNIRLVGEVPVSQTQFIARVGLVQRKLIIEDVQNQIRLVYPIGVGGFDEIGGSVSLMTPQESLKQIEKRYVITARTYPRHYEGKPFLRISDENKNETWLAFHIKQFPQLMRGFVSHGCMHLREKDLYEFYSIVMNEGPVEIPLSVSLRVADTDDHPYPLLDSQYNRVKYFHEGGRLVRHKDREGLTVMETRYAPPPIERLQD